MQILQPAVAPSLLIGGRLITDMGGIITLQGLISNSGGNTTFRKLSATTGYQVPVGKTFTVHAIRISIVSSGLAANLGYSDNDVGSNTVTAPTNPVYVGGDGNAYPINGLITTMGIVEVAFTDVSFVVPAQKYLTMVSTATGKLVVWVFGKEA